MAGGPPSTARLPARVAPVVYRWCTAGVPGWVPGQGTRTWPHLGYASVRTCTVLDSPRLCLGSSNTSYIPDTVSPTAEFQITSIY